MDKRSRIGARIRSASIRTDVLCYRAPAHDTCHSSLDKFLHESTFHKRMCGLVFRTKYPFVVDTYVSVRYQTTCSGHVPFLYSSLPRPKQKPFSAQLLPENILSKQSTILIHSHTLKTVTTMPKRKASSDVENEVSFLDDSPTTVPSHMVEMKRRKPDTEATPSLRITTPLLKDCQDLHIYIKLLNNSKLGFVFEKQTHELKDSSSKALFKQNLHFTAYFLNTYKQDQTHLVQLAEEIATSSNQLDYCDESGTWKLNTNDETSNQANEDKTETTNALLHNSRHGFDPKWSTVEVSSKPSDSTKTTPPTKPPEHLIPNLGNLVKPGTHRSLAYLGAKLNLRYGTEEFTSSVDRLVFRTFPASSLNQQQMFALLVTGFSCVQTGGSIDEALCVLSEETTHADLQHDLAVFFLKSMSKTKVEKWTKEELWMYIRCCYFYPSAVEATLPYKNTVASAMDWLFKDDKTAKLQSYKQIWAASVYSVLNQRRDTSNNEHLVSTEV